MKPGRYKVIEDYRSPYPDSILFCSGEAVTLGEVFNDDPDWRDWIWCEAADHKKAWIPSQYIDAQGGNGYLNREYDAKELSIRVGETVNVSEILNGFGVAEKPDGEIGWVPLKHLSDTHLP